MEKITSKIIFQESDFYVIATSADRNANVYIVDSCRGLTFDVHGDSADDAFSRIIKDYVDKLEGHESKTPRNPSILLKACDVGVKWIEKYRTGKWPVLR